MLQAWVWGAVGQSNGGTKEEPTLLKGFPSDRLVAAASGAHQHFLLILTKVCGTMWRVAHRTICSLCCQVSVMSWRHVHENITSCIHRQE